MKNNSRLIQSEKDQKNFVKILFGWAGTVLILAHLIIYFNINITNYFFIEIITKYIPAINVWSNITHDSLLTKTIWVYTIITCPIVFFLLPKKISKNYETIFIQSLLVYLIFGFCFYFMFGMLFSGEVFGEKLQLPSNDFYGVPSKGVWILTTTSGIAFACGLFGVGLLMSLHLMMIFFYADLKNILEKIKGIGDK